MERFNAPAVARSNIRSFPLVACGSVRSKKQFTVKVGTIFEDSAIGMDKWLVAVWLIVNCKNGISTYEVGRHLGVTQKSAWFMLHRVRLAMQKRSLLKLGTDGKEVEVDETFIGGKARNMHVDKRKRRITGTGGKDKTAVMGILERGGDVRLAVVPNRRKKVIAGSDSARTFRLALPSTAMRCFLRRLGARIRP